MSDDGDYMDDSEEEEYDDGSEDGDDAVFEAPAVQAQESSHVSLTPEECDAAAKAQVQSVVELLCCEPGVAHVLLRHFKWDRDKLTDGAPHATKMRAFISSLPCCRPRARRESVGPCLCGRARTTPTVLTS